MVISKGVFHPTVFCRNILKRILLSCGGTYEFSSNLNKLDGLDINTFHSVVLFFHEKNIADSQLRSLISFVNNGGRLFCIHGALASFKSSQKYTDLIGARFTGHDAIKDMKIEWDPVFKIRDEMYEFEISDDSHVKILSAGNPICWTRKQGRGFVSCLSPGHRAATFKNSDFTNLIRKIMINDLGFGEDTDEKA